MDFDVSPFVSILRQPKTPRLGERVTIFRIDVNMNAVELFDNAAYAEGSEVSQSTVPLLRVSDIKRSFLKKNPVWRMYLVRPF